MSPIVRKRLISSPAIRALIGAVVITASWARAENIVFPNNSSVKSVKTVHGAKGDGTTDDTRALQAALNDRSGIVYLPNGTYRVSASILAPDKGRGPWIYGQSRDGVIIKLDDNASGFTDSSSARPVIASISASPNAATSADHFMRQWHNFTVDAGNNRGAIGIRFYSNNSGTLHNVRITGNGPHGLDMAWVNMNGPLLVDNVTIEGFATGVYTRNGLNSQTMTNVTIRNCARQGVYCNGQNLSIEDLTIENVPVAVVSRSMMCIVNASFKGNDASKPAISNECCHLYCRNITTSGFSRAIQSANGGAAGATISEYTSEPVAAGFTDYLRTSLMLPIKKAPPLVWEEDTSKWVCVNDFGAAPGDFRDDTKAFQDAIDAAAAQNKTVVSLKHGDSYSISGTINVHGSVRQILGLGLGRVMLSQMGDAGFVLSENAAPVVRFENFYSIIPSQPASLRNITSNNSSTLVLENGDGWRVHAAGSGDVFINNIVGLVDITNPKAHVWARQWNTEGQTGIDSDNQGGFLWILGLKTEMGQMKISTSNGGMTELLGAHIYNNRSTSKTQPLFEVTNGAASFVSIRETCFSSTGYFRSHVTETRGSQVKTWVDGSDRAFALYSAAPSGFKPPEVVRVRRSPERPGFGQLRETGNAAQRETARYNCRGAIVRSVSDRRGGPVRGVYFAKMPSGAVAAFTRVN